MTYALGIDIGTTYTSAAVLRDGVVGIVWLGDRDAVIPSAVFLAEDGSVLIGEPAIRRGLTEPDRLAARFKRRMGDSAPMMIGGAPMSAESLAGQVLRFVVAEVTEREGGPPSHIAVTHPANWGPFKRDRLDQAIRLAGLDDVVTITEPEAAAMHYASNARVDVGSVIAVYDLGGGTFDAAVLRKTESGFEVLGPPEGIEQLGGIDFDDAVFAHVRASAPVAFADLDEDDPAALTAVARIRSDCVDAKEALSSDTQVTIGILLPNTQSEIRLMRSELEAMLGPPLQSTVEAMQRALRSADTDALTVTTLLLVGGSSRIPLVAQLMSSAFKRPIALDVHPKHAVALGAALVAGATAASPAAVPPIAGLAAAPPPTATESAPQPIAPDPTPASGRQAEDVEPPDAAPAPVTPTTSARIPKWLIPVGIVAVVAIIALAVLIVGGSGGSSGTELSVGQRIAVGDFPDGVAVDQNGLLWVASTRGNTVTRIDSASGTSDIVPVPDGSEPLAVAVTDDGGVWVSLRAEDRIVRFDPDSMELTDSVDVAPQPAAFGQGDGSLWVAATSGQVDRIDPEARQRIAEIPVPSAAGVTVSSDAAWVTQSKEGTVAKVDLGTNQVVDTITVGAGPDDIEVDLDDAIWVSNRGEGTVSRIDTVALEVTDTLEVGIGPANMVIDGNDVWLSDRDAGAVTLIDRQSIEVSDTVAVGSGPLDLALDGDRIWVSVAGDNEVVEVTTAAR